MDEYISVLIPTFNRAQYIEACLESIFTQTYSKLRVVIYDDGSTDRTVEIAQKFPLYQLVVGKENRGVSYARNQLLNLCDTRYAAWQDSDDISNIHRLAEQYQAMLHSRAPLVFCQFKYFRGAPPDLRNGTPIENGDFKRNCMGGSFCNVELVGSLTFDEAITMGGEDLIWFKAIEKMYGSPYTLDKLLYFVRSHPERISKLKLQRQNRQKKRLSDLAYKEALKKLQ